MSHHAGSQPSIHEECHLLTMNTLRLHEQEYHELIVDILSTLVYIHLALYQVDRCHICAMQQSVVILATVLLPVKKSQVQIPFTGI